MEGTPYIDVKDRISRLPDNLIHHIMSFMDTKYAVQTCVLSKRWIHIWKSLPFLNFNRWSFSNNMKDSFVMFVDMVFIFREEVDIQKFSLEWESSAYDSTVITNVNRWSIHAVKHNVQELSILIDQLHNTVYEIPQRLFKCKSLTKLKISAEGNARYADIILPRSMSLPRLKKLYLCGLSISNVESSKRLFSSCPVLEALEIVDCNIQTDYQRNLVVDSNTLKVFAHTCWSRYLLLRNDAMVNIIKVCAPNLEEFTCRSFLTQDYSLEICSPPSLVCFDMTLEENEEDENAEAYSDWLPNEVYAKRVMQFLGAVYMVKTMSLSPGFLEVLSHAPDVLDCQHPRLCDLQYLTLGMWSTRGCLRAIAYLLSISPNIVQLYLELKESYSVDVGDVWEAGLSSPGMLSNLKIVEIENVEGCDAEFKILRFLLENAKDLEEVVIFFCSGLSSPNRIRRIVRFKEKLRAVPTASSDVELVFHI
ncbi:hypothetical protein MKW98_001458 [Papaver atlanticum]|uniref:F-box domain-containing protein n=1 Tax=Papaver atlanticum TaxID=357466 RepID=A0AAD4XK47_9MAGN|nr:hypothetical protein MKW98_001458 [Papaver atlanticum]